MTVEPGVRGLLWITVASLIALAILIGLGTWQLQRLAWKESLIERIEARATAGPAAFASVFPSAKATEDAANVHIAEFTKVALNGTWRHAEEIHLYGIGDGKPGWQVLTPFELSEPPFAGRRVFINRGFVPLRLKEPDARAKGQPTGPQSVVARIRAPQQPGLYENNNNAARNEWFWRDVPAMADTVGAPGTTLTGLSLDLLTPAPPGGWPAPNPAVIRLPNRHLEYALTWFGLALTLIAVYAFYVAGRLKRPSGGPARGN